MKAQEIEFWMNWRRALLLQIDTIERMMGITPRTADLRRLQKKQGYDTIGDDELTSAKE